MPLEDVRTGAHGWRRLVLAVLTLALSLAVAAVLIPPDPDVTAAVEDVRGR